jgi:thermitase
MENDTNHTMDMSATQSPPPMANPSNVGKIAVGVAVLLFFIGLFLYVSSSDELKPKTSSQVDKKNTASSLPPKAEHVPGQIIVKFKEDITDQQITERLKPLNASIKNKIEGINTTVLNVPPGQEESILKELSNDPIVKYAEPDYIYHLQFVPNDPQFNQQWALNNTGQIIDGKTGTANADIRAEQAWDVTKGAGVKVAILDSGIDTTHPEFAGKIVMTKLFSAATSIADINGHGTHVAGILAAKGNNGQGISGVCPECQLMIGKIAIDDTSGSVPTSAIAPSIIWASDNGAKVINMSIAGPNFSQAVQDAVTHAWSNNAVIIAAAGNDGGSAVRYPGAYVNVVSVANTNSTDTRTPTSNFGTWVSVAAPGDNIFSTFPTTPNLRDENNYGFLGGTSMASPSVAGVAALVWSTRYGTSNAAVVQRLFDTADKIPGTGTQWVHGRINAANAVAGGIVTPSPSPIPTATPTVAPTAAPSIAVVPSNIEPTEQPSLIPSFVCAGSTASICTPTAIPGPSQSPDYPTGTIPSVAVSPSGIYGNPTGSPMIDIPGFDPGSVPGSGHHHPKGGVANFVALLLGLFFALIQLILSMFGVN